MELFKENKKSEAVEATQGGTCTIIGVRESSYNGRTVYHVTFIDEDGDMHTRSTTFAIKAGLGSFVETKWSAKSTYGGASIRFSNF
jgi:hypothetical protein